MLMIRKFTFFLEIEYKCAVAARLLPLEAELELSKMPTNVPRGYTKTRKGNDDRNYSFICAFFHDSEFLLLRLFYL